MLLSAVMAVLRIILLGAVMAAAVSSKKNVGPTEASRGKECVQE